MAYMEHSLGQCDSLTLLVMCGESVTSGERPWI